VALKEAYLAGAGTSVVGHQLDVFLFEPESDRYLGRLCSFNQCPKGNKFDCLVPGCGAIPFNKRIAEFTPRADLLLPARYAMLYRRGTGRLRSALDLPTVQADDASSFGHHCLNRAKKLNREWHIRRTTDTEIVL